MPHRVPQHHPHVRDAASKLGGRSAPTAPREELTLVPTAPRVPERVFLLGAALLFCALVAAFHGPTLHDPLGCLDQNGGWYFGVSSRAFHDLGFAGLRGAPVWLQVPGSASDAITYHHHPPLWFWICALCGSSEAALRAPGILASVLAALAGLRLLRRQMPRTPALGGALLLLGLPSLRAFSVVSYEPAVVALGLWFLLATRELVAAPEATGWRAIQCACAMVAPWIDLGFAAWCLGAAALATYPPWRASLQRLVTPALVALASLGLWLVWRMWATRAPGLRTDLPSLSLADLVALTRSSRPSLATLVRDGGGILVGATTSAVAAVGVLGLAVGMRRDARFFTALVVAGCAWPIAFATHAATHAHFWAYLAVALALGAGSLGSLRPPGARWLGAATTWLLAGIAWITSDATVRANATSLFRDVGGVATRAASVGAVATNSLNLWPYYARNAAILSAPISDPALLELLRSSPVLPRGYAYLWLDDRSLRTDADARRALETFLAPFPHERLPQLEVEVGRIGGQVVHEIRQAWLVHVPPRGT